MQTEGPRELPKQACSTRLQSCIRTVACEIFAALEDKERKEQEAKERKEQEAKERKEQEAKERKEQEAIERKEQEAKERKEQEVKERKEQEAKEQDAKKMEDATAEERDPGAAVAHVLESYGRLQLQSGPWLNILLQSFHCLYVSHIHPEG